MAPIMLQLATLQDPSLLSLTVNPKLLLVGGILEVARRGVTMVYECFTADVQAIFRVIADLVNEIAVKVKQCIKALVRIISDTEPDAAGKRKTYCVVTLQIGESNDPYTLQMKNHQLLSSLRNYESDFHDLKNTTLPQRMLKSRELQRQLEVFREECLELNAVATRSSARILEDTNSVIASRNRLNTIQATPGEPVEFS
ncbi:uncharacterized protein PHACADRAFT_265605 [Phanerochaete carnosa HHB-10118-sp]|uniref:Uncharacterized protein n=1 Tax=Phanerochaete carnosa (strain HHB-10118-sp) TaxID=650164 RepID=K5UJX9_PHACS|nr:uncharacterized protein PHACADRAFT_265605 [Phanerochaete carnosa HHB-10118-sp]EKM49861.1 hypothetical protein PHACADRAFT_265605 [Phanerochaete carnosa HHB-10118-sp]